MLKQISIYAENKKGTMRKITSLLAENEINILGSVTNDSAEYGIVRMVVSNPDLTVKVLKENGFLCRTTDVIGVELSDEPGNLNKLLQAIEDSFINVNYMYLSFNRESGMPIIILHTEDTMEVESNIAMKGFTIARL